MSRLGRNPRRDANEPDIIDALELHGCAVLRLSIKGAPDLAVFRGERLIALVEVKTRTGKIRPTQTAWAAKWNGPAPVIVRSVDEAIRLAQYGTLQALGTSNEPRAHS